MLTVEGQRVAVYKNEHGELQAVSAVCTHLGCIVDFNSAQRTWDCACHGSRFHTDGTVIQGPATRPLKSRLVPGPAWDRTVFHQVLSFGRSDATVR